MKIGFGNLTELSGWGIFIYSNRLSQSQKTQPNDLSISYHTLRKIYLETYSTKLVCFQKVSAINNEPTTLASRPSLITAWWLIATNKRISQETVSLMYPYYRYSIVSLLNNQSTSDAIHYSLQQALSRKVRASSLLIIWPSDATLCPYIPNISHALRKCE